MGSCSNFPDTNMPGMIYRQSRARVCFACICIISCQEVLNGDTCCEQMGQAGSSMLSQQLMLKHWANASKDEKLKGLTCC